MPITLCGINNHDLKGPERLEHTLSKIKPDIIILDIPFNKFAEEISFHRRLNENLGQGTSIKYLINWIYLELGLPSEYYDEVNAASLMAYAKCAGYRAWMSFNFDKVGLGRKLITLDSTYEREEDTVFDRACLALMLGKPPEEVQKLFGGVYSSEELFENVSDLHDEDPSIFDRYGTCFDNKLEDLDDVPGGKGFQEKVYTLEEYRDSNALYIGKFETSRYLCDEMKEGSEINMFKLEDAEK